MSKKIVHYSHAVVPIVVGCGAIVVPIDHPSPLVTNGHPCHTTTVLWYEPVSGLFETLNTMWRKHTDAEDVPVQEVDLEVSNGY